jgi:hypothetical protein
LTASRRASCHDGAEKTSAATPNFSASRAWAAMTCSRIEPEPTSRTRGVAFAPFFRPTLGASESR